jgi:hypothetical protein
MWYFRVEGKVTVIIELVTLGISACQTASPSKIHTAVSVPAVEPFCKVKFEPVNTRLSPGFVEAFQLAMTGAALEIVEQGKT